MGIGVEKTTLWQLVSEDYDETGRDPAFGLLRFTGLAFGV